MASGWAFESRLTGPPSEINHLASTSYWLTRVWTDSKGHFSFLVKNLGRSFYWTADFRGATGYFACWAGKWVLVTVK